jgi:hypothetical protein
MHMGICSPTSNRACMIYDEMKARTEMDWAGGANRESLGKPQVISWNLGSLPDLRILKQLESSFSFFSCLDIQGMFL